MINDNSSKLICIGQKLETVKVVLESIPEKSGVIGTIKILDESIAELYELADS